MERLTVKTGVYQNGKLEIIVGMKCGVEFKDIFDRLAAIEDILGDEYDVSHLRELAQADREGRCVVLEDITVSDLQQMLSILDSTCYGDGTETYTTGYRNGHRNGRIEILRHVLGIHEGTSEDTEAALRREQE